MHRTVATALVLLGLSPLGVARAATPPPAPDDAQVRAQEEEVRKGVEALAKELEQRRKMLREGLRQVAGEMRRNKEVMREVVRELAADREELKRALQEAVNDPEMRKSLQEIREIIDEVMRQPEAAAPPAK